MASPHAVSHRNRAGHQAMLCKLRGETQRMDSQGPVGLWSWGAAGTPGGGFSPPATSFQTLDVSCQRIPYLFFLIPWFLKERSRGKNGKIENSPL